MMAEKGNKCYACDMHIIIATAVKKTKWNKSNDFYHVFIWISYFQNILWIDVYLQNAMISQLCMS